MKIKDVVYIAEGWSNLLLDSLNLLDESKKEKAKERLTICMSCPVRDNDKCSRDKAHINKLGEAFNGCGCYINSKVLSGSKCPGNFW